MYYNLTFSDIIFQRKIPLENFTGWNGEQLLSDDMYYDDCIAKKFILWVNNPGLNTTSVFDPEVAEIVEFDASLNYIPRDIINRVGFWGFDSGAGAYGSIYFYASTGGYDCPIKLIKRTT